MAITFREEKAEKFSQRGLQVIFKKQSVIVLRVYSLESKIMNPAVHCAKHYSSVPLSVTWVNTIMFHLTHLIINIRKAFRTASGTSVLISISYYCYHNFLSCPASWTYRSPLSTPGCSINRFSLQPNLQHMQQKVKNTQRREGGHSKPKKKKEYQTQEPIRKRTMWHNQKIPQHDKQSS